MTYVEYEITANADIQEILISELSDLGFESFVQDFNILKAYIQKPDLQEFETAHLLFEQGVSCKIKEIAPQNWNQTWEDSFEPVLVENKVFIRANFHQPKPQFLEIIINPKMSFGTGHHPTTALMVKLLLEVDIKNKTVLDIGSGTGILAILASKLGATEAEGIDNHEWAHENALENASLNNCKNLKFNFGTIQEVDLKPADLVLANINKNAILADIGHYEKLTNKGGQLMLSGFFDSDKEEIIGAAQKHHFKTIQAQTSNSWAAIHFQKI